RVYLQFGIGIACYECALIDKAFRLTQMRTGCRIHKRRLKNESGIARIVFSKHAGLPAILCHSDLCRVETPVALVLPIGTRRDRSLEEKGKLRKTLKRCKT